MGLQDVKKGSGMSSSVGFNGFNGFGMGGNPITDDTEEKFGALRLFLGFLIAGSGVSLLFFLLTGLLGSSLEVLGFVPTGEPADIGTYCFISLFALVFSVASLVLSSSIEADYKRMKQLNRGNSLLRREMFEKMKTSQKSEKVDIFGGDEENDYITELEDTVHNLRDKAKDYRGDISALKTMVRELYAHCVSGLSVDSWKPLGLVTVEDWEDSFKAFSESAKKSLGKYASEIAKDKKED